MMIKGRYHSKVDYYSLSKFAKTTLELLQFTRFQCIHLAKRFSTVLIMSRS
jgi:hypothetical protein